MPEEVNSVPKPPRQGSLSATLNTASLQFALCDPAWFGEGKERQDVLHDTTPPRASACQGNSERKSQVPHNHLQKQVTETETSTTPTLLSDYSQLWLPPS